MTAARLKSEVWVSAHLRRCFAEGLYGTVLHKGAAEAGAVFVLVNCLNGNGRLYGPAPGPAQAEDGSRRWIEETPGEEPLEAVNARIARKRRTDPDLWAVEIEDRLGKGRLDEC